MKEPEYPITKMFPWRPKVEELKKGEHCDLPEGFKVRHTHLMQVAIRRKVKGFTLTSKSREGGGIRVWRVS